MKWYLYSVFLLFLTGSHLDIKAQIPETYLQEAVANNPKVKAKYAEFEVASLRSEASSQSSSFGDDRQLGHPSTPYGRSWRPT